MSAVISGNNLGVFDSSLQLGRLGPQGQAFAGRAGQSDLVYVNASTGNLVIQRPDEYLASLGLDIGLTRTYNSQGLFTDDNGDNWRLNIHQKLYGLTGTVNTTGSTITKVFGDGAEVVYRYDTALGLYVGTAGDGAHDTLGYNAVNLTWTWLDGSSERRESYDNLGRLTATSDRDGNTVSYVYTGVLLTSIIDASGQTTYLDYSGNNLTQVRSVSAGVTQTRVRYTYDTLNRLEQVIVDLTPADNSITDNRTYVTRYTYDGTSTRVASVTSGDGSRVGFTYILVGTAWKVETVTDGVGGVTRFNYLPLAGGGLDQQTDVTDALGNVTSYFYDAGGRLKRVLSPTVNAERLSTSYSYDAQDNLADVIDGNGNRIAFSYDGRGNRISQSDARGNTVVYKYSATNQMVAETVYLVPDPDADGPLQASEPATTRYVYDAEDHLRFVVSPAGRVTEYRYDAAGNRLATIRFTGNTYDVSALAMGDVLTETNLTAWLAVQNLSNTQRTDTSYDFRGQINNITSYTKVNASGDGVIDGTETTTHFVYGQAGDLLQTVDARGTATLDPNDYVTTYQYDGLGRLLSTVQWISATETRTTVTQYDDVLNRSVTTLANGLATSSIYDARGALVQQTRADTSQAFGATTYVYDKAGLLRMTIDPLGFRSYMLYDNAGRASATIDVTGAVTELVYDKTDKVVKTIAYTNVLSAATLATLVDVTGQPTQVSLASLRPVTAATDRVTSNVYDAAGRLIESTDAEGYVTRYSYDGAGQLTGTEATSAGAGGSDAITITVTNNTRSEVYSTWRMDGTEVADQLIGGASDDTIYGRGGIDTISGGDGVDVLYGDAGNDVIDGGLRNDTGTSNA